MSVRVQPGQHERDGGGVDERLGRGHGGFVVVAEATVAAEPGEGPFDTPQRLERDELVGPRGTSPDVDRDAEFFTGTGDQADVCGVGEHLGKPDELRFHGCVCRRLFRTPSRGRCGRRAPTRRREEPRTVADPAASSRHLRSKRPMTRGQTLESRQRQNCLHTPSTPGGHRVGGATAHRS